MTTKLSAPVARETTKEYRPDGGGRLRPLIVTLLPGDVLELRPKGLKQPPIQLALGVLYEQGVYAKARAGVAR